jgi:hypothetical protein
MNWYESERTMHEHVLHAERVARSYPHVAHLLERESGRRHANRALVALGGLLITWGNKMQERWAVELPACTAAPMATNNR